MVFLQVGMTGARSSDAMEPLAFAVLKALTPAHIAIDFYDERIETVPDALTADWVIMSANSFTVKRAYQWCEKLRARGVRTALGGFHASMLPNEAAHYADVVFVGDAEGHYSQFIDDISSGEPQAIYRTMAADIWQSHYDYSVFKGKRYPFIKPIQYARGCRHHCDFCSIHGMYRQSISYRDPQLVAADIRDNQMRFAFLVDDNLFSNRQRVLALLAAIKPLGIQWACQISIDIAADQGLIAAMVEAGCAVVLIGFESLSSDNLQQMNKAVNARVGDYQKIVNALYRAGLMVYGTFVLGYDADDPSVFREVLQFAQASHLLLANFNPLIATPGTALYDRLAAEGRLLYDKWWLADDYRYGDTVFQPNKLTPEALRDGCLWARRQFYRHNSIARRWWARRLHQRFSPVFLATNYVSRREILRKQGRELACTSP